MDNNIPSAPAYSVFISQLIRFLMICGTYITNRSSNLGFDITGLQNAFRWQNPTALYTVHHMQQASMCTHKYACLCLMFFVLVAWQLLIFCDVLYITYILKNGYLVRALHMASLEASFVHVLRVHLLGCYTCSHFEF